MYKSAVLAPCIKYPAIKAENLHFNHIFYFINCGVEPNQEKRLPHTLWSPLNQKSQLKVSGLKINK
uniref:Uncharacterized protein n=1 Tax=Anguilla anguilla TaxID=7936 RepID=A0A0E9Q3M3_ANGAN